MVMMRSASAADGDSSSVRSMARGLLSGDAAEHAADGHADAGQIALAQHVAGHDLAGSEHVGRGAAVCHQHPGMLVHLDAEVGEGDAGLQRSEEHTSELQSLMRISYAVFCLKKKK